jgi:hypothetical protein
MSALEGAVTVRVDRAPGTTLSLSATSSTLTKVHRTALNRIRLLSRPSPQATLRVAFHAPTQTFPKPCHFPEAAAAGAGFFTCELSSMDTRTRKLDASWTIIATQDLKKHQARIAT